MDGSLTGRERVEPVSLISVSSRRLMYLMYRMCHNSEVHIQLLLFNCETELKTMEWQFRLVVWQTTEVKLTVV